MTTIKLLWSERICRFYFLFSSFFLAVFLLLFLCVFFKVDSHSLPAGVNPGTADQFSTALSAICQIFSLSTQLRNKRSYLSRLLSFFFLLSSPAEASISYLTAPLLFTDTSLWTRAQGGWPSDKTLHRAATGWGSGCLTGCGPTWCRGSEFMSGIWRKRPSCRPPRCVWQVMLAENTDSPESRTPC